MGELGGNRLVTLALLQRLGTVERAHHQRRPSISAAARYGTPLTRMKSGLVTSKGIVTHQYDLNDWVEAMALANSTKSIKVLLTPGMRR